MTQITHSIDNPAEFTERFINQTSHSIFLTGKAGTGKTTLLRKIVENTHKQTVIVAPTGIAALNAGGVTIHSFFQLPFGGFIPEFISEPLFAGSGKIETKETLKRHFRLSGTRINVFRNLELLIIDEVSMLRADLLDAIDWTLRNVRKNNSPFGGVQVLFIGDLLQLPPVIKPEEWSILRNHYNGIFFFHAHVLREQAPLYIELTKIYRQADERFINVLNNLRNNHVTEADQKVLNEFVQPNFKPTEKEGYITLTTHNSKADGINETALRELKGRSEFYTAEIQGEFPPHLFPLEERLELKVGAQVMFIKNDLSFEKNYYNGKMGRIDSISEEEIIVLFPEEKKKITVEKYEWNNIKYTLNEATAEIEEEVLGTFVHYPLKLAWAITVHKSQGLTFEKAVLDVSQVFAPGQAYVALSRLTSLDGLVLLKPIAMNGLQNDSQVVAYAEQKASVEYMSSALERGTAQYVYNSLISAFDWYDYATKWAMFELGFKNQGPKTEKGKDKSWVANQLQTVQNTMDAAKKFQGQINTIFSKEKIDWEFLNERVQAAYAYFFKPLDNQVYSLIKRRVELSRIKKTKVYSDELEELENLVVELVLHLKKVRLLIETVVNGKELNKDTVRTDEVLHYKLAKTASINQELRQNRSLLELESEEESFQDVIKLLKKDVKKEPKEKKRSTFEITLDMLEEGYTAAEIARTRQLSKTTINTHFVNLIKAEKIELSDVMEEARIREIETYFEEYEGNSLTPLKEKLGDKVSWDELKLVQASKLL